MQCRWPSASLAASSRSVRSSHGRHRLLLASLCNCSYEGNALEDPWTSPSEDMFTRSVSPENVSALGGPRCSVLAVSLRVLTALQALHSLLSPQAPNTPTVVDIEFEKGDPVALDGVRMSPATILTKLNKVCEGAGRGHGPCENVHMGVSEPWVVDVTCQMLYRNRPYRNGS